MTTAISRSKIEVFITVSKNYIDCTTGYGKKIQIITKVHAN